MRPVGFFWENRSKKRRLAFNKKLAGSGALILNAGYEPLKVVNWQKAIVLWLQDKVDILEYHSVQVRSASAKFKLPSVLRLRKYIRPNYSSVVVKFSRQNLFIRDNHTCQYCGNRFPEKILTVDHVKPVSKGGGHEWTNVVAACGPCNNKKGDMTPEQADMPLRKRPVQPKWLPSKEFSYSKHSSCPDNWEPYLIHIRRST